MFNIITQTDITIYSVNELHVMLQDAQAELYHLPVGSLRYILTGENIRMLQKAISTKQAKIYYQPKPPSLRPF